MFKYWNDAHKIGYIDGVYETQLHGKDDTDPKYRSYKWAYAHEGYNGSFDDYLMREAANAIKLDI